jgi:thioredoxin reductase
MQMSTSLRAWGSRLSDSETVSFAFEGETLRGRRGESVAAALAAAGIRALRTTRTDAPRGIFCGMGVCQECLVEIDGISNQRACMTKLERPVTIRRQDHLAQAVAGGDIDVSAAAPREPDVLVIGGGAGGLSAARCPALAGAKVILADDRPLPGEQYYKQPLPIAALAREHASDGQFAGGRALIEAAERAGVTMLREARVWGAFEPPELLIVANGATRSCRPKRLIVAAGAYERGTAGSRLDLAGRHDDGRGADVAAQLRCPRGRRLLVAGNGPLNFQVALELARAGAEVTAIVELARRPSMHDLSAIGAMLASTPSLALRGVGYIGGLRRRRIPVVYGSVLAEVAERGGALTARVKRWPFGPHDGGQRFEVDAVTMGYGFMPSNEI